MASYVDCRPAPPAATAPSLLEIQQEQERQLAEERSRQEQQAKVSHRHCNLPVFCWRVMWNNSNNTFMVLFGL